MKSNEKMMQNKWGTQTMLIFCVLYTIATIANSILYLANGYYEDPNGNWHELDRAVIVFIGVLALVLIKNLEWNSYFLKMAAVYAPTMLLVFGYIWLSGFREPLAQSAFRDIFINYTFCFGGAAAIGYVPARIKRQMQQTGADR